ncbi:TIM-barrel domain-containing protein [Salinimonas lutimaris]|uniref:TIM-barrel domain-containing protein n=1 Tax=Salinimonas lutimaris TaxID=914153 RepID=UPI0010C00B39|nr:TIM-barrel domain-containing protein [Salinimonas lutimaris]
MHSSLFIAAIMRRCLFIFFVVFSAVTCGADLVSYEVTGDSLRLQRADNVTVTVKPLTSQSLEVIYEKSGEPLMPSLAINPHLMRAETPFSLTIKSPQTLTFSQGSIKLQVDRSPLRLSFIYADGTKVSEAAGGFFYNTFRGIQFALAPDEKIMGGGERVLGMNRRGHRMPLYNKAAYGYSDEPVDQMYFGLPAIMSSSRYAIMLDSPASGYLDIGHTQPDKLQFEIAGGRLAYIVSMAASLPELVKQITTVTGKQPLPPRWALGNFASRFGYRTEQETRDVVDKFNQDDIPLDAVVLDLYWFGNTIQGHMGNLNWDTNAFPDPVAMIRDFKQQDIHTVVITEPFILSGSSEYSSARDAGILAKNINGKPHLFDFYFGNTGLVDIFSPKAQQWFWQYYERLLNQGIDGWWGDLGEPEVHPGTLLHNWQEHTWSADEVHNGYGHKWAEMVYTNTLNARPEQRPFLLMRSGFLGSQRYGMMPWTGDVSRTWGGLNAQIELSLQMSLFGLAYTHSDLGGFAGGDKFDAQLYTRWLQAGTFFPVFRPHAHEGIAPEPVFHDEHTKAIARRFIKLRYAMLPYNYSLSIENSLTGMPLMRPMSFTEPARYFDNASQFMWGDALLVRPIAEPDVKQVDVTLPDGIWFDFFDDTRLTGGRVIQAATTPETLPVYVKAGAFMPMQSGLSRTADYQADTMTMHYWADGSVGQSGYTWYEDDGKAADSLQQGKLLRVDFSAVQSAKSLELSVTPEGHYPDMPGTRTITWHIHGLQSAPPVSTQKNWEWNETNRLLSITTTVSNTQPTAFSITL